MKTFQYIQNVRNLLLEADKAIEEFFKSPYRNDRALNFLNGKACAYRRVLDILEKGDNNDKSI